MTLPFKAALSSRVRRRGQDRPPEALPKYLEVRFEIAANWFDLLSAALDETGCLGLEYRDGSTPDTVKVLAYFPSESSTGSVLERLVPWLRVYGAEQDVQCDPVADQDWNSLWRATYLPVEISARLVVLPAWSRRSYPGRLLVRIKPEQAFGTGSHETTRLCLAALEQVDLAGKCVADVGTGSGILAIAAARLGARTIYACDPDQIALSNARHNVRMNRVAKQIELACADLSTLPQARFDLVVANLVLDPLREGLGSLARACRPGADVFLSGLLAGQGESLVPLAKSLGFSLLSIRRQEEWQLLHLRATAPALRET